MVVNSLSFLTCGADGVCHLCEEIPKPRVNVPKGIAAQLTTGFISTFVFYVALVS